ncbi:DUF5996 family protein [Aequorivita sp. SDUM287046]|uniref:DUF5996 family protein n=1 Tax=Aequorivita aurantiaca TaxID=3053356 RepID=A0ABT8DJL0_9FLAO|nr:DUF5996 family protein [Aequorivita aurantiaca]MDN3724116.1 DUF5996 family protein [Aequorivita aurantiaca]
MSNQTIFPAFPLSEWLDTKETLHRYFQIVGKLRLSLNPKKNHWWHITFYATTRGVTTRGIPFNDISFEIYFDFISHTLNVWTSNGEQRFFELMDGLSVAEFYKKLEAILKELNITFDILEIPFDLSDKIPFNKCIEHHSYDKEAVHKAWKILLRIDMIFQEFSGRSYSKTCPVHIYWHHFDLVVTRFSGKKGPKMNTNSQVELEAYSHEMISFGFWFGDDNIKEPAFYSYTYPSPKGIDKEPLKPNTAKWQDSNGSPLALLLYSDLIKSDNPEEQILDFLQSSYQAGAKLAGWNIEELKVPS